MTVSYEEAVQNLTGPEGAFAIREEVIDGQAVKVFDRTPNSLRELFDTARERGDDVFLVYEDERWSFTKVMEHVDALGSLLVQRYGVEPGDRVSIGMRNYPEWIVAFAAITSIGAVSVSLNAWWTPDETEYGLEDSGSKVLICDGERAERAAACRERLGFHGLVVRAEGKAPEGFDAWEEILPLGEALPEVPIEPDWDATILYTSGTTGRPKGAVSTHRAVLSALVAFACRATLNALIQPPKQDEATTDPNAFILVVPLFHVTGCVAVMLSCFASGTKLVMMYKWNPERALELIERERITSFVGVPTMSWDLLESPDFERRDTSSLQNVGGGGAPAPPELVRRIDKGFRKGRPSIGYGMTETNAYGPQNAGDDYLRKPTSSGRVVPVVDLRVTNEAGDVLPSGEVGEIWFRGPHLIRGYWNRPEATAETIVEGWLRSGDLGYLDDEGFIFVQDRAKDMVLRAGENIYSAEVEAAIYEHPAIYEAAVFGIPHERLGEEVAATVFLKEGMSVEVDALQAHVRERLAAFKVPTQIEFVGESLPRNASGKILKRELRDAMTARMER